MRRKRRWRFVSAPIPGVTNGGSYGGDYQGTSPLDALNTMAKAAGAKNAAGLAAMSGITLSQLRDAWTITEIDPAKARKRKR